MLIWITMVLLLVSVAWQDFHYRSVQTWLFPALALLAIIQSHIFGVFSLGVLVTNLTVISLQLLLLNLVICWRFRTNKWLMHKQRWIGWGDIAFFGVASCFFSTFNFLFFYVGSLIMVLVVTTLWGILGRNIKYVPLAGGQALGLGILLLYDTVEHGKGLYKNWGLMERVLGM